MAEYVWIDAEGGVRSKTKVRVTPIITGGSLSRNLSQPRLPRDKPASPLPLDSNAKRATRRLYSNETKY